MDTKDGENTNQETAAGAENTEMGKKLKKAGKKAEDQKVARRERTVKGAHLLPKIIGMLEGKGLTVEEKSGFTKVTGVAKGRAVYVAKKGGRVDLSGFTVEGPGVVQISEEDARAKHLGKVRGQLDFDQGDDAVLAACSSALERLAEAPSADAPTEKKPE
jgi:hypothetical protein